MIPSESPTDSSLPESFDTTCTAGTDDETEVAEVEAEEGALEVMELVDLEGVTVSRSDG